MVPESCLASTSLIVDDQTRVREEICKRAFERRGEAVWDTVASGVKKRSLLIEKDPASLRLVLHGLADMSVVWTVWKPPSPT